MTDDRIPAHQTASSSHVESRRPLETEEVIEIPEGELERAVREGIDIVGREHEAAEREMTLDLQAVDEASRSIPPNVLALRGAESGLAELPSLREGVRKTSVRATDALRLLLRGEMPEAPVLEKPVARANVEPIEAKSGLSEEAAAAERAEEKLRGALVRLERDIVIARALDRLETGDLDGVSARGENGERTPEAVERHDLRNRLAATLEGRAWHKPFTQLESGDLLCCVMTPSSLDRFGMKSLNDDLLWRTDADNHIDARREICREAFANGLCAVEIEQDFKGGYFRIPKSEVATPEQRAEITRRLNAVMADVNARVRSDMKTKLERALALAGGDAHRSELIRSAITSLDAYAVTLGTSDVAAPGAEGDYAHVERAVLDAQKASQLARHDEGGSFVRAFNPEAIPQTLDRIAELRDGLRDTDVIDAEGRAIPVFIPNVDGLALNLDLVRDVRKRAFAPAPGQEAVLRRVEAYIEAVNILDPGKKPFMHAEIAGKTPIGTTGRTLSEQIALTSRLAAALRSDGPVAEADRRAIREEICREGHDRSVTSRIEFNRQALEKSEATYLTLDVLDVGPRQIESFNRALQRVEREADGDPALRERLFVEAAETAGDEMTGDLRQFRADVNEAYQDRYRAVRGGKDAPIPAMAAGGDEATIVVDPDIATDAFILALQKRTQARVTKNVIGAAARGPETDPEVRKREHVDAIQRADDATEKAKKIEKRERRIRTDLRELSAEQRAPIEAALRALRLTAGSEAGECLAFAVIERDDGRHDLLRSHPESGEERASADDILRELDDIDVALGTAIASACAGLLARLGPTHPNLNEGKIRRVLRRLNISGQREDDPRFEAFLNAL